MGARLSLTEMKRERREREQTDTEIEKKGTEEKEERIQKASIGVRTRERK